MRIGCLNGEEKKEIVFRVFRVNEEYPKYPIYPKYPRYIFAEIAVCASDKGENGKVRETPQSLRDSSPINKGAKKFTVLLKRSRGVGRIT